MTYASGPGGGYAGQPGQVPGQPGQGRGLPFALNLGVLALGVVSFFLGFAPFAKLEPEKFARYAKTTLRGTDRAAGPPEISFNFFGNVAFGVGLIGLTALLAAALIAGYSTLAKQQQNYAVIAGLSTTGFLALLFQLIGLYDGFSAGIGLILVLIIAFVQAAAANVAFLVAAGVIKPPAPRQLQYGYGYGQPPTQQGYYGQAGPAGPPTGPSPTFPPPSQPQQPPPPNPW